MFTLLFGIYSIVIVTLFMILSALALVVCYPFDSGRKAVHWCSKVLCMCFWRIPPTWRITVEGLENVDRHQPYVIAINHNSMVDIISLYFIPLTFRWVSKREVFRIPWIGEYLYLHGDIAIERGSAEAMVKVREQGKMWIGRGVSVAIFPEGTRSKDGEIHRFKQGAFLLAKEAGVPVLPVILDGTTTVFRKDRKYLFNWREHLTVRALKPISAEEVAASEPSELAVRTHDMMAEALADIRSGK